MLGSWPMREHLTHGSPHAEFEGHPSDANSRTSLTEHKRHLHGPPNCLFRAYFRHRALTGGSESFHFATECLRSMRPLTTSLFRAGEGMAGGEGGGTRFPNCIIPNRTTPCKAGNRDQRHQSSPRSVPDSSMPCTCHPLPEGCSGKT